MTGTLGGALEARQVPAGEGRLTAEAVGEIETEDGVLVIKRIHVRFTLTLDADADREKVARAFAHYKPRCPVYRSLSGSIAISDELELV
ncbi:MAG TPA: OsmC family protein [Gaiellaceae bacterium]